MEVLISVIVPIYNSELYLEDCISSLLKQSHSNLELILVNDGSCDGSLDICRFYEKQDSRVRVIDKTNDGVSVARNCGLETASGDYIAFVDSDDVVSERLYEKLLSLIESTNSDCAVLSKYIVNKNGKIGFKDGQLITADEALEYLIKLKFPTSMWAYLYKKSAVYDIRVNEDIHFYEDLEFNARVLLRGCFVSLCDEDLYFYRQHSASANSQGLSTKRLTCLNIPEVLKESLRYTQKSNLLSKLKFLEAYLILSVLDPLKAHLHEPNIDYMRTLSCKIRKAALGIIFSPHVPLRFKLYISLASINTALAVTVKDIVTRRY